MSAADQPRCPVHATFGGLTVRCQKPMHQNYEHTARLNGEAGDAPTAVEIKVSWLLWGDS